jgi:hypothetical protein
VEASRLDSKPPGTEGTTPSTWQENEGEHGRALLEDNRKIAPVAEL